MKINKFTGTGPQTLPEHDTAVRVEQSGNQFALDLSKFRDKMSEERLTALLEQITSQGKRLASTPTYAELKTYRGLISKFLGEAVSHMYSVESQAGWDRQGRQKMYTIIKQIDSELADLTEAVRHGQERQLDIMAKLDVIRGMLVDLYT